MYNTLKRLSAIVSIMMLAACASQSSNLYQGVTGSALVQQCLDPVEVHNVPPIRFPIPAQVARHHNCMGVSDLLVITWPLDSTAVNVAAVNLLSLMYVEYENQGKTDTQLQLRHIKNDHFDAEDTSINVAFYELIEVPVEKTE